MALQSIKPGFYIPETMTRVSGQNTSTMTLNADNEKAAMIFLVPETGTCIGAGFRTSTVVTGDTVTVELVTVSATTGDPVYDGSHVPTLYHANATTTLVIADSDDNAWLDVTWTGFTVTRGDIVALVITLDAGATAAGTDIDITKIQTGVTNDFPYIDLFTTSWVKTSTNVVGVGLLRYSSGVFHPIQGMFPYLSTLISTFNSADNPDEIGLKFSLPFPVRVTGFWLSLDGDNDFDVVLYDNADSVLQTISMDSNQHALTSGGIWRTTFDGTEIIAKDTTYRLVVKPGAINIRLFRFSVNEAGHLDAHPGGSNFAQTQRTNAGAWTDITTERPLIGILIDQFDDGVGGAGGGGIKLAGRGGGLAG